MYIIQKKICLAEFRQMDENYEPERYVAYEQHHAVKKRSMAELKTFQVPEEASRGARNYSMSNKVTRSREKDRLVKWPRALSPDPWRVLANLEKMMYS